MLLETNGFCELRLLTNSGKYFCRELAFWRSVYIRDNISVVDIIIFYNHLHYMQGKSIYSFDLIS